MLTEMVQKETTRGAGDLYAGSLRVDANLPEVRVDSRREVEAGWGGRGMIPMEDLIKATLGLSPRFPQEASDPATPLLKGTVELAVTLIDAGHRSPRFFSLGEKLGGSEAGLERLKS